MPAQTAPASPPATIAAMMCRKSRQLGQRRADPNAHDRADEVLALPADVEHPAAEGERDREPGEDEPHPDDERLLQVDCRQRLEVVHVPRKPDVGLGERNPQLVGPDLEEPVEARAFEDRLVRVEGVLPGRGQDDEATDQKREDRRHERHDEPAGLLRNRQPGGEALRVAALWRLVPAVRRRPDRRRVRSAHATAFLPAPVIAMPSSSSVTPGANSPTISALVDHEDPVGEGEDLFQLQRDEQDCTALVALLDEAAVDELDRADVEAARRLGRDQHLAGCGRSRARARPSADYRPRGHRRASAGRRRGRRTRCSRPRALSAIRFGKSQPKREAG